MKHLMMETMCKVMEDMNKLALKLLWHYNCFVSFLLLLKEAKKYEKI